MSTNTVWSPRNSTITNGSIKISTPPSNIKFNLQTENWIKLNPNSANRAVKNLEYRVNNLNVVEFRYPTTSDPNGPKTVATSIQEIADDKLYVASYGYLPQTTNLIQDSLRKDLIKRSEEIGWAPKNVPPPPKLPRPNEEQDPSKGGNSETESSGTNPLSDQNRENLKKEIETKGVRQQYGNLRYPLDLNSGTIKQDVIKFTVKSYGVKTVGENLLLSKRDNKSNIEGSVVMAIQPRISDANSVSWSGSGMNVIEMGAANASLNIIEGGFQGTVETIDQLKNLTNSDKQNLETSIKIYAAQQAASTQNLLSRLKGGVLNPNLELLFEGPALRSFSYTFELSPRSKPESESVRKIIRFFKQNMAVQRSQSELFLKAPNVFDIQYLYKEGEANHPYINKIKGPCALTNCSVDYTPSGSYMTFGEDGGMISYLLSLTFEELEPVYADDYDGNDNEIGF